MIHMYYLIIILINYLFILGAAHIWFQRSEAKDRLEVARRLKDHVEDPDKLPILIFPEGTCINNTVVMQFKKGSFEVIDHNDTMIGSFCKCGQFH